MSYACDTQYLGEMSYPSAIFLPTSGEENFCGLEP